MWQTTHISLLQRLADGQHDAWQDFHARYGELLLGYCRARGLQPADAEDVLQDILVSLSKAMPGFQYDRAKGTFRAYLKTVAHHAIARRFRQKHPAPGLEPDSAGAHAPPESDEHWEVQWRRYHLRRAMAALATEFSQRDLDAFDRYALAGEEPGAIAADLNLSMDNLYQIKSRVTRRLTALIQAQIADEG
jgi:RNA polymerase sigma factor (sigma-70 family)